MRNHVRLSGLAASIFLLAAWCGVALAETDPSIDIDTGPYKRTYVYHAPAQRGSPLPVVLVLPDAGGDGAEALSRYKWDSLSDKEGFIAVGLTPLPVDPAKPETFQVNPSIWSDGSGRGDAVRDDPDDTGYVHAVLADLGTHAKLDKKRIYATGFGNGGSMAELLGMTMPETLAAVAAVAGHLWSLDQPRSPLSVLLIHGAEDPVEPIGGGMGVNLWTHGFQNRPIPIDSAKAWAKAMGCGATPVVSNIADTVPDTRWTECDGKVSIDYLVLPHQGYHWPGGEGDMMPVSETGPAGTGFDATSYIWKWFRDHSKK